MNDNSIVYGIHAVKALLMQSPQRIKRLYIEQGQAQRRLHDLIKLAERQQIQGISVSKEKLNHLAPNAIHQGVIACLTAQQQQQILTLESVLTQLEEVPFLLILDGVQDPHNLGACLRSANAAGIHAVIAPKDRAVNITPVVRKVASGAAEITPFIQVTNLARTLAQLKERNIWIYGADEAGEDSLYETDLTGPVALVLGAEGTGLRRLTRECCDKLIHIPTIGAISSLNVSVATGVCLFEALRQRKNGS